MCVWISGMCFRKVTGSDRHVKNPLGLCRLSVPHTHSVFLACYPPCTHKDTLTLSWIICHADLLSSFVTCSDLLCSPVLTTEAILLLGHHFAQTSQDPSSIISVSPVPSLFSRHPTISLSMCQDQTSGGLWLYIIPAYHKNWIVHWIIVGMKNVLGMTFVLRMQGV